MRGILLPFSMRMYNSRVYYSAVQRVRVVWLRARAENEQQQKRGVDIVETLLSLPRKESTTVFLLINWRQINNLAYGGINVFRSIYFFVISWNFFLGQYLDSMSWIFLQHFFDWLLSTWLALWLALWLAFWLVLWLTALFWLSSYQWSVILVCWTFLLFVFYNTIFVLCLSVCYDNIFCQRLFVDRPVFVNGCFLISCFLHGCFLTGCFIFGASSEAPSSYTDANLSVRSVCLCVCLWVTRQNAFSNFCGFLQHFFDRLFFTTRVFCFCYSISSLLIFPL